MDARGDCPNIWEALAPHRAVICLVENNKEGNIALLSYRITLYCTVLYCVVENNKGKIGFFELKRSLSPSLSFQPLNQLVVLFQTGHK